MMEIFIFLNFGKKEKRKKKEREKRNIEVSKIFNFGNLMLLEKTTEYDFCPHASGISSCEPLRPRGRGVSDLKGSNH